MPTLSSPSVDLPAFRSWSMLHRDSQGRLWMTSHRWMNQETWQKSAEALDPTWMATGIGCYVVASKLEPAGND